MDIPCDKIFLFVLSILNIDICLYFITYYYFSIKAKHYLLQNNKYK